MEDINIPEHCSALDPVTGLYSRQQFFNSAELLACGELPYAILVLNLDYFKQINDTAGYDAGDLVLLVVADVLRASLREGDIAAHVGKDEFVVGLWQATEGYALSVAQRIRRTLADQAISFFDRTVRCTVSIGVAESRPDLNAGLASAAKRASTALSRAKQSGGNRVLLADAWAAA